MRTCTDASRMDVYAPLTTQPDPDVCSQAGQRSVYLGQVVHSLEVEGYEEPA